MTDEINLEEVSSTTATDAVETHDVVEAEAASEPATETAPVATTNSNNVIADCVTLYDLLTTNTDKLVDCHQVDISGIEESKPYNYLMYATDLEKDKSLILLPKAENIAILQQYVANITSIRVLDSGVVILSDNARVYVNMSGTVHFVVGQDGSTANKIAVSKIRKNSCAKKDVTLPEHVPVEVARQIVKTTSIRMLPVIEAETTVEGFRAKALDFMTKIRDINHLLKIENDILACL